MVGLILRRLKPFCVSSVISILLPRLLPCLVHEKSAPCKKTWHTWFQSHRQTSVTVPEYINSAKTNKPTNNYTYKNYKYITLQKFTDILSLYAILMPTARIWLAKGTGWLGINLKSDPAVLIRNTALWPAVKKSLCLKKPTFAIIRQETISACFCKVGQTLYVWEFMWARYGVLHKQTLPFSGCLFFIQWHRCKSGSILQFDMNHRTLSVRRKIHIWVRVLSSTVLFK